MLNRKIKMAVKIQIEYIVSRKIYKTNFFILNDNNDNKTSDLSSALCCTQLQGALHEQ